MRGWNGDVHDVRLETGESGGVQSRDAVQGRTRANLPDCPPPPGHL
jgi:hypothetical protein